MLWSGLMEQAIGALKDEKISLSLLAAVCLLAWYSITWAGQTFVEMEEFEDHTEEVGEKLINLTSVLQTHVEEYRITEASRNIRELKRDIQIAEQLESPEYEIEKMQEQLVHAEEYKRCLIRRGPNCKHLRWPE
jgi:hypothetical protein